MIVFESAVLLSLSPSSSAVRSMSPLFSVTISFLRWPVSSSRRVAGMAEGNTESSASASSSTPRACGIPRARGTARGAELALRIDAALDESSVPGTGAWGLRTLDASGSRGCGSIGRVVRRIPVRKHPRSGAPQ